MRAVIQRVSQASVKVEDREIGRIGAGLLVLLGVGEDDGPAHAAWVAKKIVNLRVFEDDQGKMNRSLKEVGGGVLVVSQFTLYGDCRKGNRPSFSHAAPPQQAETLYRQVMEAIAALGVSVAEGKFQAMMEVSLVNQGPVTLILETPPNLG